MKIMQTFRQLIFIGLFIAPVFLISQVWVSSDSIGFKMKNYGELEIFGPVATGDTVKQVDRITPLVGVSESAVFDYMEDADTDESAVLIASPTLSDMEGYTSINNYYSFSPPDVHVAISTYAWDAAEYVIAKMVLTNIGSEAFDGRIGFEIIPQIAEDYDGISSWIPDGEFLDMTKSGENHVGIKFLSHPMTSLSQFVWYSGYNGSDSDLYNWMNYGQFDTTVTCDDPADGIVSIPATDPVTMEPDVGITFFYCVARGQTLEALGMNIDAAEAAFYSIFAVAVDEPALHPQSNVLSQNYPNPFNPSTEINFVLPQAGKATLNIHKLNGELVQTLQQGWMSAGSHTFSFTAEDLPSGIYIYSLLSGGTQIKKKMTLLK